jgi:hypothetical protein
VSVYHIVEVIRQTSQLYVRYVFQAEYFTVFKCLDNDILKLFGLLQTSFVADGVLEALLAAFAELAGSRLYVLLR